MKTTPRRFTLAALAALAACGGSSSSGSNESATSTETAGGEQLGTAQALSNTPATEAAASPPARPAEPPPAPVTVTPGTPTPLPENLRPRVQITAPRDNARVATNSVEVRLRVTDWPAPQDNRHVHLILDNEPYVRIDDPSRPHRFENLAEGTHVVRAFPGWSNHESVKRDGAFAMVVFHVGRPSPDFALDRRAPLLTYSRPKGDYLGTEGDRVLLDFYVTNVPNNQLSPTGHRVRYAIDGTVTGEATAWVPHYIEHLRDGSHTVTLDLLGPDGQPVPGRFNHTERTIRVDHSAPTPPPHNHAASAGDAGAGAGDAGASPDAAR